MSVLDLGAALVAEGRCPACRLDDRPIWTDGDRFACASCWTRLHDGDVRFSSGAATTTARQLALPGTAA